MTQNQKTWALRIGMIAISLLLAVQSEWILAGFMLFLIGNVEWYNRDKHEPTSET